MALCWRIQCYRKSHSTLADIDLRSKRRKSLLRKQITMANHKKCKTSFVLNCFFCCCCKVAFNEKAIFQRTNEWGGKNHETFSASNLHRKCFTNAYFCMINVKKQKSQSSKKQPPFVDERKTKRINVIIQCVESTECT